MCLGVTVMDLRQIKLWAPEPNSPEGSACPCKRLPLRGGPVPPEATPSPSSHPREMKIDCCQDKKGRLERVFASSE